MCATLPPTLPALTAALSGSLQSLVMLVSLSYFLYDLLCCSLEVPFDAAMAFHHVFTILGLSYGIISGHVSSAAHRFKNKCTFAYNHECE